MQSEKLTAYIAKEDKGLKKRADGPRGRVVRNRPDRKAVLRNSRWFVGQRHFTTSDGIIS